jgi:NAD(P)-dependent dehydrogenase (short-subunit alcohol dehydrogenase family)
MKTILITGCSSGIGRETARYFAERGWNVIATMRNMTEQRIGDLAQHETIHCYEMDVTDPAAIERVRDKAIEAFGGIDVVVNNAAYTSVGPGEGATLEQVRSIFETNLFGAFSVMKAFTPHFRKRRKGTFINLSSFAGRVSPAWFSIYAATKHAVEALSEGMYGELSAFGITIKIIEPGGHDTRIFDEGRIDIYNDTDLDDYRYLIKGIDELSGRLYPPVDVARAIYRAATSKSRKIRYPVGSDIRPYFLFQNIVWREPFSRLMNWYWRRKNKTLMRKKSVYEYKPKKPGVLNINLTKLVSKRSRR